MEEIDQKSRDKELNPLIVETYKKGKVKIEETLCCYSQESDSCADSDVLQFLHIKTQDAGDGKYFVIETERWAFDKIEDLIKVLRDFENRIKVKG